MAESPDFVALARSIVLAAGRQAQGVGTTADVIAQLARDLADAWPADDHLCAECSSPTCVAGTHSMPAPTTKHSHDTGAGVWEHSHAGGDDPHFIDGTSHIAAAVRVPVQHVDTPAQHVTWAANLIGQMSRQRLDTGQSYAVEEALSHLRRAAELLSDEVWADAPAVDDDELELCECPSRGHEEGCEYATEDDPDTHGPGCSSNPEIGCVCGLAERQSEEDEYRNAPDQRPCPHPGGFRTDDGRWECSRCGHVFASYEAWGAATGNEAHVEAVKAAIADDIAGMER